MAMIRIRFGRFFSWPGIRRCVMVMKPSWAARRRAFWTERFETPALAAIASSTNEQMPLVRISSATILREASSTVVNWAAIAGGIGPEKASWRLRRTEAFGSLAR